MRCSAHHSMANTGIGVGDGSNRETKPRAGGSSMGCWGRLGGTAVTDECRAAALNVDLWKGCGKSVWMIGEQKEELLMGSYWLDLS
jgi:hypothetical protein